MRPVMAALAKSTQGRFRVIEAPVDDNGNPGMVIIERLGLPGHPDELFIDKSGKIVAAYSGVLPADVIIRLVEQLTSR